MAVTQTINLRQMDCQTENSLIMVSRKNTLWVYIYIYIYIYREFRLLLCQSIHLFLILGGNRQSNLYTNPKRHNRRSYRSQHSMAQKHNLRSPRLLRSKPYFDLRVDKDTGYGARNITTVEGGRAVLICTIRNLGSNKTVSIKLINSSVSYDIRG